MTAACVTVIFGNVDRCQDLAVRIVDDKLFGSWRFISRVLGEPFEKGLEPTLSGVHGGVNRVTNKLVRHGFGTANDDV